MAAPPVDFSSAKRSVGQYARHAKKIVDELISKVQVINDVGPVDWTKLWEAEGLVQPCRIRMDAFSAAVVNFEVIAEAHNEDGDKYTDECDDLELSLNKTCAKINALKLRAVDEKRVAHETELQGSRTPVPQSRAAAKKMDIPKLASPETMRLMDFRHWKMRFEDYAAVTRLFSDCNIQARRGILRSAIHEEWTKMWAEGVIMIDEDDDVTKIVETFEEYLRQKRHPLVDRREFIKRIQHPGDPLKPITQPFGSLTETVDIPMDVMKPALTGKRGFEIIWYQGFMTSNFVRKFSKRP